MHDTLSGRAEELGRLTDLIRTSLSLADSSIPAINAQLDELAAMGLDNLGLEGPLVYSRAASRSPNFDDTRVVFAATLMMPGGLGCTIWGHDGRGPGLAFSVARCRGRVVCRMSRSSRRWHLRAPHVRRPHAHQSRHRAACRHSRSRGR